MSTDGAHDAPLATRPLRENEAALLLALLAEHPRFATFHLQILSALVTDLLDGGMGSIRFSGGAKRVFGDVLAQADYVDADGVPVSITIDCDDHGDLFEIDIWKVDFSPLKQYPHPAQLTIKQV